MHRFGQPSIRTGILLGVLGFAAGCDLDHIVDHCHDCGPEVTRTFDLAGFDEIDCQSAFQVTVRQSDRFRVEVRYPQHLEHDIQVHRDGARLRLSLEHGCIDCGIHAVVELPRLRRLQASEASHVDLERIVTSGTIDLSVESASQLDGDLVAGWAELRLSAASRAELSGITDQLRLDASAVSRAQLRSLAARRADVELSGASEATIRVSEWLDVTASGVSVLRFIGNPQLGRVDLSGGSRLERER